MKRQHGLPLFKAFAIITVILLINYCIPLYLFRRNIHYDDGPVNVVQMVFVSHQEGYALQTSDEYSQISNALFQTKDGGRHWSLLDTISPPFETRENPFKEMSWENDSCIFFAISDTSKPSDAVLSYNRRSGKMAIKESNPFTFYPNLAERAKDSYTTPDGHIISFSLNDTGIGIYLGDNIIADFKGYDSFHHLLGNDDIIMAFLKHDHILVYTALVYSKNGGKTWKKKILWNPTVTPCSLIGRTLFIYVGDNQIRKIRL